MREKKRKSICYFHRQRNFDLINSHLVVFVLLPIEYSFQVNIDIVLHDKDEFHVNLEKKSKHDASTIHLLPKMIYDDDNHQQQMNAKTKERTRRRSSFHSIESKFHLNNERIRTNNINSISNDTPQSSSN